MAKNEPIKGSKAKVDEVEDIEKSNNDKTSTKSNTRPKAKAKSTKTKSTKPKTTKSKVKSETKPKAKTTTKRKGAAKSTKSSKVPENTITKGVDDKKLSKGGVVDSEVTTNKPKVKKTTETEEKIRREIVRRRVLGYF